VGQKFAASTNGFRMRPSHAIVLVVLVSTLTFGACRANLSSQEQTPAPKVYTIAVGHQKPAAPRAHLENDVDRAIRIELEGRFSRDPMLKDQEISFIVDGGDVTATGHVKTIKERERVNQLAMSVPSVRSVSNTLRVSP
jgi:osmotically-inducible protein OsmY